MSLPLPTQDPFGLGWGQALCEPYSCKPSSPIIQAHSKHLKYACGVDKLEEGSAESRGLCFLSSEGFSASVSPSQREEDMSVAG